MPRRCRGEYCVTAGSPALNFDGKPPLGGARLLSIMVIARDGEGREVSTIFRIKLGNDARRDAGRAGLSEQLRLAANRDHALGRYAGLDSKLPVR